MSRLDKDKNTTSISFQKEKLGLRLANNVC